jgi:hypothetical protein
MYLQNLYIYIYKVDTVERRQRMPTNVGSACALSVAAVAISNVSSCSDKLVHGTVTAKMAKKKVRLSVLIFSLGLYVYLSSQEVRN